MFYLVYLASKLHKREYELNVKWECIIVQEFEKDAKFRPLIYVCPRLAYFWMRGY